MTLQLLWEEYRAAHPDGYGYSRFCELYRPWEGRLSPTMRQTHVAGERMFVDYAGTTLPVIDAATGAVRQAQLFVAALGASNYTYRRGDLDAEPARLDRLARPGARLLRRRAGAGRVRQPEGRRHQGLLLRARGQPHLRRDGGALRHGDGAGAALQAARQGQGRGRRPGGDALDHRRLRNRALLLARRAERGDPRPGRRAERPRHPPSRREPPAAVRGARAPGAEAAAGRALRLRAVAGAHGRARLPRRGRAASLLGARTGCCARRCGRAITARTVEIFHAASASPRIVRRPPDRRHTTVREHMPSSHRRYADWTPEQPPRRGRRDRPQHLGAGRGHPARAHAPRAGLPLLPRHPAAAPGPTAASGSRRPAAARSRSARAPTPRSTRS